MRKKTPYSFLNSILFEFLKQKNSVLWHCLEQRMLQSATQKCFHVSNSLKSIMLSNIISPKKDKIQP